VTLAAEVVVYAATSAGVCAAVAAASAGAEVLLVEPGRHVGGMTSAASGTPTVQSVDVPLLQRRLRDAGQVLSR
jgi:glycine/D-amino acid oxidase-like deaminating enzyme